jgi:hypothetical protein
MTSNALIAPVDGSAGEPEIQSPPTITEQEIGEFREQDRVLPVCFPLSRLCDSSTESCISLCFIRLRTLLG